MATRAEWLFWVGCTGAMIDRNVKVTRAVAKVLRAGGVDFAVLGAEECCSGDPARRVGQELTFQVCAKTNLETLERYGVRKIVTACPHCFNTLENEYPRLRRQLRGRPPQRADRGPRALGTPAAPEDARLAHLPRPLLSRAPQRGVRRAARGAARALDGRRLPRSFRATGRARSAAARAAATRGWTTIRRRASTGCGSRR